MSVPGARTLRRCHRTCAIVTISNGPPSPPPPRHFKSLHPGFSGGDQQPPTLSLRLRLQSGLHAERGVATDKSNQRATRGAPEARQGGREAATVTQALSRARQRRRRQGSDLEGRGWNPMLKMPSPLFNQTDNSLTLEQNLDRGSVMQLSNQLKRESALRLPIS